jgi:hypothetical protein
MELPEWAETWYQKRKISCSPQEIQNVIDWLHHSEYNIWRFKEKLYKITWKDAVLAQEKWHLSLKKKKITSLEGAYDYDIYQVLDNGYKWCNLKASALRYEGEAMGHCVNQYQSEIIKENIFIFSLRDKNNIPHLTLEYNRRKNTITQCVSHGNNKIPKSYQKEYLAFLNKIKPTSQSVNCDFLYLKRNDLYICDDTILEDDILYCNDLNYYIYNNYYNNKINFINVEFVKNKKNWILPENWTFNSIFIENSNNITINSHIKSINMTNSYNVTINSIFNKLSCYKCRNIINHNLSHLEEIRLVETSLVDFKSSDIIFLSEVKIETIKDLKGQYLTVNNCPLLREISNVDFQNISLYHNVKLSKLFSIKYNTMHVRSCFSLKCELEKDENLIDNAIFVFANNEFKWISSKNIKDGMEILGDYIFQNINMTILPDIICHGHVQISDPYKKIKKIGNIKCNFTIALESLENVKIGEISWMNDLSNRQIILERCDFDCFPEIKCADNITLNNIVSSKVTLETCKTIDNKDDAIIQYSCFNEHSILIRSSRIKELTVNTIDLFLENNIDIQKITGQVQCFKNENSNIQINQLKIIS